MKIKYHWEETFGLLKPVPDNLTEKEVKQIIKEYKEKNLLIEIHEDIEDVDDIIALKALNKRLKKRGKEMSEKTKYVYFFGAGATEGNAGMKNILGGKGAY